MNFRDYGRQAVDSSIGLSPYTSKDSSYPYADLIGFINLELSRQRLLSLNSFINTYSQSVDLSFGFLFEPSSAHVHLNPVKKLTKKANSPYFCAKINVRDVKFNLDMGSVYLVPASPNGRNEQIVVILRPDRQFRLNTVLKNKTFEGLPITVIFEPYDALEVSLNQWAVLNEAIRRS